ncbi:hypothetical protein AVEN_194121-1 [Araneus ventricosus]|uniref:Uncharacterized protein n=1 Tax=Araneus ventricosus TaxID=182803 RepID=A0A4Y2TAU9_ARAVE|nr:hypothetical protein AVEN_194121-1 [Araneus ventricosus]
MCTCTGNSKPSGVYSKTIRGLYCSNYVKQCFREIPRHKSDDIGALKWKMVLHPYELSRYQYMSNCCLYGLPPTPIWRGGVEGQRPAEWCGGDAVQPQDVCGALLIGDGPHCVPRHLGHGQGGRGGGRLPPFPVDGLSRNNVSFLEMNPFLRS